MIGALVLATALISAAVDGGAQGPPPEGAVKVATLEEQEDREVVENLELLEALEESKDLELFLELAEDEGEE